MGNRATEQELVAGWTRYYTYDDNDKLTKMGTTSEGNDLATFGYDSNGNMTSVAGNLFGSKTLVYNDENRLTSIAYGGVTDLYYYNWQGLRYRARLNGTYWRYVYNGDRVLEETNDSGTVLARYTTESGSYYQPLHHMWRSSSTSRFPLYDAIGTARMLVDGSGTVTDTYHLDAWGEQLGSSGSTVNPYRYGAAWGYITDPSGMLQLGARFYWPEVGRFVQQDPLKDGVNWYVYVEGMPTVAVDPSGYWAKEKHGELADIASANSCLNKKGGELLHRYAEGPDELCWAVLSVGTWPHFGEDRSATQLSKGIRRWRRGKCETALDDLGWGLHNCADILVHPENRWDHLKKGFSEDPAKRPKEWDRAQAVCKALVDEFCRQAASPCWQQDFWGRWSDPSQKCRDKYFSE